MLGGNEIAVVERQLDDLEPRKMLRNLFRRQCDETRGYRPGFSGVFR